MTRTTPTMSMGHAGAVGDLVGERAAIGLDLRRLGGVSRHRDRHLERGVAREPRRRRDDPFRPPAAVGAVGAHAATHLDRRAVAAVLAHAVCGEQGGRAHRRSRRQARAAGDRRRRRRAAEEGDEERARAPPRPRVERRRRGRRRRDSAPACPAWRAEPARPRLDSGARARGRRTRAGGLAHRAVRRRAVLARASTAARVPAPRRAPPARLAARLRRRASAALVHGGDRAGEVETHSSHSAERESE